MLRDGPHNSTFLTWGNGPRTMITTGRNVEGWEEGICKFLMQREKVKEKIIAIIIRKTHMNCFAEVVLIISLYNKEVI